VEKLMRQQLIWVRVYNNAKSACRVLALVFLLGCPGRSAAQVVTPRSVPSEKGDTIATLRSAQKVFTDSLAFYADTKARLEQRAEQLNKDTSSAARSGLNAVQDSLRETNRRYGGIQSRVSDLGSQIDALASDRLKQLDATRRTLSARLSAATTDAQRTALQLEEVTTQKTTDSLQAIRREELVRELAKMKANVAGWENLGGVVSTVSLTAQQLLIFPEADSGIVNTGQSVLQWLGVGTAIAGSIIAARGNATSGSAMLGGGLSLSAIIQKALGSNKKLRNVATRVARNVGFTDDVNSLANLTPVFRADAERLRGELDGLSGYDLPSAQQLNTYYKLISQQRAIFGVLSAIRARGQFLLDTFGDDVSPKSRGSLKRLLEEAERATSRWYSYEPVLLQPYEFILRQKRGY
jgi:hypothetical protein